MAASDSASTASSEDQLEWFRLLPDGESMKLPRANRIAVRQNLDMSVYHNFVASRLLIGHFSIDQEGSYSNSGCMLRFLQDEYYPGIFPARLELPVSLNLLVSNKVEVPEMDHAKKALEGLLHWIKELPDIAQPPQPPEPTDPNVPSSTTGDPEPGPSCSTSSQDKLIGVDFVATGHLLSKLLETSYYPKAKVKFYAQYTGNTVYLLDYFHGEEWTNASIYNATMSGKFRQYLTGDDVLEAPSMTAKYRKVIRAKLGCHNLLYSVVVDCGDLNLFDTPCMNNDIFLTLKCIKEPHRKPEYYSTAKYKMVSWFCSTLLSMIPKVIVGYRNKADEVTHITCFRQEDLLRLSSEYFNKYVPVIYLNEILYFVKMKTKLHPGRVLCFWRYANKLYCEVLDREHTSIVPNWYPFRGSESRKRPRSD